MRAVIFVTSLCSFCWGLATATDGQDGPDLSKKAQKLASSTSDPFFDFGFSDSDSESTTEDPFFSFDDDEDDFFTGFLPPCSELFEIDQSPGVNCKNDTEIVPEVRLQDPIFQRLIAQVWADFQYKLNTESSLYGVELDPFDVDAKLPEPIDMHQVGSGYSADIQMSEIKMYGLSGINLDTVSVTRSENLTDFKVKVVFGFDHLEINGTYALKGFVGWWELDSKGQQPFSIKMLNATLAYEMEMDLVSADAWDARRCSEFESMQNEFDNVLIEEIGLKLRYDDVDFKFENLGSFANTVVNGIGIYFLQIQEEMIVGEIRNAIKKHVNSLIC